MPDPAHIHITTVNPYLETQGWFIENYVKNPDYDYAQERFQIALFTEDYTPAFTDTIHAIPLYSLRGMQPLRVARHAERLHVHEVSFPAPRQEIYHGCVVWIIRRPPVLILSSREGFPCNSPVSLSFDCQYLADQIQHAAFDAQCVRALIQTGSLAVEERP